MDKRRVIAMLLVCACAAAIAGEQRPDAPTVLRGQWNYLDESSRYCMDHVPALRDAFLDVREQASASIMRAEDIIQDEARDNTLGYESFFRDYAAAWIKLAGELVAKLKKQDAAAACPGMLANWQSADVDLVIEDWRVYIERNGPVPRLGNRAGAAHGTAR